MADLSSLNGLTFNPNDYAEDAGQFLNVDFSQFAATGTVTVTVQAPIVSNADEAATGDGAGNLGQDGIAGTITSVDTSATTPFGLGTVTISDIDSITQQPTGNTYTADIIGVNNGQVLLGIEPYDSTNPTDPYDGQYVILSDSSLSESGDADGTLTTFSFSNTNPNAYQPPCFTAGTRIATPAGEVPVESLAPGDLVLTVSGAARPITWVGHRHVDIARHPRPDTVRPVLITAGAVADATPARDLLVSPDHALLVDGVLIPAKYLVNDVTVRVLDVPAVTYHHIELAEHDVVLAENMPAETFLDTGNRANFAGGAVVTAHPDFGTACDLVFHTWEARGYAPLTLAGPALERARARLALRADQATPAAADTRAA